MNIEKINVWFARLGERIVQRRRLVLAAFVLLFAVGFYGIRFMNINNSWDSYFLEDDPMLVKTEEFKEVFGNDYFVAVLTSCDNTFTKNNLELIRKLSDEMLDSISYADKITSITDLEFLMATSDGVAIEQIVPDEIPSDKAGLDEIRRKAYMKPYIAERLVSADGKLSWILLKLRPFPDEKLRNTGKGAVQPDVQTGEELHRIITKPEYAPLHLRGAGMPYTTERKMKWVGKELPRVMGLASLLAIIVLLFATRSVRGVVVPLVTAVSSIVIVYGAMGYLRYPIDSSMVLIPMLLAFAVAIAYNIHVHTYFRRQFLLHGRRRKAVVETVGEMGWPILFSALTTFAALLSFLVVPVVPLHFVGITTSSSVMLTFVITLTVMPIMLSFGKDGEPHPQVRETGGGWLDRKLVALGSAVLNHAKCVLWVSAFITAFLIYQFTKLETTFDVEKTMGRKIEYVRKLLEIGESELGSIYSYDVMIDLPGNGDAKTPENLMKLDSLASHVARYPLTKRTTSVINILKDLHCTLNEGKEAYYTLPRKADEVAQLLLLYENAGGSEAEYWIDYEYRRLRLMVEISTYDSGEAERNIKDVTAFAQKLFPGASVSAVGNLPQFTTMMQYVARGQIWSFALALLVIGVMMMAVFGSVRIGLIGLIPNIMPAIVVGGLMGWLDYPLDMMTATIMPMILGLAVDDTIHFINHGHLEFDRQQNYRKAILRTFCVVGTPIVLTSLVMSFNFAMYGTSDSLSFFHMGILSVAGILAALLADLCITPVLFQSCQIFGKEK
ncbi:efflux RND transporter permease subunit [Bacteroides pyogenes]|uniref:efflux RND transporter permease subunit n=1 Tax=Bacteroides pyogenes TaxID=310300 RepID=UPI00242FBC64|nr:MMPL family transporter [Bacteroides pyogenes]